MNPQCPFCNISMYRVLDVDYPKLLIYQCYECGFTVDKVLLQQKGLYNAWERLFYVAKPKGIIKPKLLPKWEPDESKQGYKPDGEVPVPKKGIHKYIIYKIIMNSYVQREKGSTCS